MASVVLCMQNKSILHVILNVKTCSYFKLCDKQKKLTTLFGRDGFKLHSMVADNKNPAAEGESCESPNFPYAGHLFCPPPYYAV